MRRSSSEAALQTENDVLPSKIWIDVEDLFQYAAFNPRPSGIQRIEYELCRALASLPESRDRVRFVRHAGIEKGFYSIPYRELDALYGTLTSDDSRGERRPPEKKAEPSAVASDPPVLPRRVPRPLSKDPLRRIAYSVPTGLRNPLVAFYKAEREAGRALAQIGSALGWAARSRLSRALGGTFGGNTSTGAGTTATQAPLADGIEANSVPVAGVTAFDTTSAPGDILLVLGSPWFHPFYAELVGRAQRQRELRFALLVYDIIPLRRPEWCDHNLALRFREWTTDVFPLVDSFLTISRSSATDIVRLAHECGYTLRAAPQPIPIGTGFTSPTRPLAAEAAIRDTARLPAAGSYALIVCTIEARKNHILLFRVWRRMLEEMPHDLVPTLVFAGRVGWLVSDLMQQLRNADFLDGKIRLVEDPTDDELEQLYAGCRFTLFPSLYEGWGLPVTESLAFGKPCVISRATSLPEAGGHLARYFDPENAGEAYDVIRYVVETPEETQAWAEQVRREFRPVSWAESARGVLRALGLGPEEMEVSVQERTLADEHTAVHPL
ncbi:glycosyltransferase family 4 protein [Lichenicoccus sp.]|uniref:glycosyltransferase family 4 protein n=1 Tax=Lichenicoccus sp. TaxID=2781899 RepID=UPI003D0C7FE0